MAHRFPARKLTVLAAPVAVIGVVLAVLSTPQAAQAALQQYALNAPVHEIQMKYSAVASIAGGRAQLAVSNQPRTYIQTLSGGVLVASSFADNGGLANLSHATYGGAQSRCYWDYLGASIGGTVNINCWRQF